MQKNIRITSLGFSPFQVVFGTNPRIPGAIENEPPAQNGKTLTTLVQNRLQSIFDARRALAEVDNKHRLKAADQSKRATNIQFYSPGSKVYYRMGNESSWAGPGKVLAQDNKLLFIRHGRRLIVASPSRVQMAHQQHKLMPIQNSRVPQTNNQNDIGSSDEEDMNEQEELRIPVEAPSKTGIPVAASSGARIPLAASSEARIPVAAPSEARIPVAAPSEARIPVAASDEARIPVAVPSGEGIPDSPDELPNMPSVSTPITKISVKQSKLRKSPKMLKPVIRNYPKAGNYVFMKHKEDSSNNWERVKIWQTVTKGTRSPHGPYYNWERSDGSKTGGYIDYYDWHFEGNEQQPRVNIGGDIRSYITINTEEKETLERQDLLIKNL